MDLDKSFYVRAGAINWLSTCGNTMHPDLTFPVLWVDDRITALQSLFSRQMANAMTAGQGDLTGFLAKYHYDSYAGQWNDMARESRNLLEKTIGSQLLGAVKAGGWAESLAHTVLPELTPPLRSALGVRLAELLQRKEWERCLLLSIIVNTNRAAMEIRFRQKFNKAPIFFERMLQVYEAGRLPCGWDGQLEDWPKGRLIIH